MILRLLWASVALCAAALIVLGFALYQVNSGADADARRFAVDSRKAIVHNCREVEELRSVIREIMEAVIRFNIEDGTAGSLRRAEEYARIVEEKLMPVECVVRPSDD